MKHITKFKLFESSVEQHYMKRAYSEDEVKKTDEIITDLKDILLELSDIGYTNRVAYKVLSPRMVTTHPQIQINITKKSGDILLPLWNTEEDKIEFDDVILRVLRYAVDEGYKYEYTGFRLKSQVVNYSITLYTLPIKFRYY